jgi:hypothetical protein
MKIIINASKSESLFKIIILWIFFMGLALPAFPADTEERKEVEKRTAAAEKTEKNEDEGKKFAEKTARKFASLALECVHKEYPNKIGHVLQSDKDVMPPRKLTPSFYGCFDWHSAVHGHWLLVRLTRLFPTAPFAQNARKAFALSLTPDNIAAEVRYLKGEGRKSFERPYGLAWLLQLSTELRGWDDPQAEKWKRALLPLEETAVSRLREWLPKLSYAVRSGEHSQTAFAFGLALDWSRTASNSEMSKLLESRIRDLYLKDRDCPMEYEPSGQDFLSPCLAEADLMRRILSSSEFAKWLDAFLPDIPLNGSDKWIQPAVVTDPTDGKIVHLDGLNLSRAWMLEGIAAGLPEEDSRLSALLSAAATHAESGLRSVTGEHYEGGHWLASFAVYLMTERGLPDKQENIDPQ